MSSRLQVLASALLMAPYLLSVLGAWRALGAAVRVERPPTRKRRSAIGTRDQSASPDAASAAVTSAGASGAASVVASVVALR